MEFAIEADLFEHVTEARAQEWRLALLELNQDTQPGPPALTCYRRRDGGVDVSMLLEGGGSTVVPLPMSLLRPHFREYRDIIEQIVAAESGFNARRFETIDYAKKLVHDEAGEALQERLASVIEMEHAVARRFFTLIFLVSTGLPEALVTKHRNH